MCPAWPALHGPNYKIENFDDADDLANLELTRPEPASSGDPPIIVRYLATNQYGWTQTYEVHMHALLGRVSLNYCCSHLPKPTMSIKRVHSWSIAGLSKTKDTHALGVFQTKDSIVGVVPKERKMRCKRLRGTLNGSMNKCGSLYTLN